MTLSCTKFAVLTISFKCPVFKYEGILKLLSKLYVECPLFNQAEVQINIKKTLDSWDAW